MTINKVFQKDKKATFLIRKTFSNQMMQVNTGRFCLAFLQRFNTEANRYRDIKIILRMLKI